MSNVNMLVYKGCEDFQLVYNPGADDPRPILEEGESYTLKNEQTHSWCTLFELNEVPGLFPSVCFRDPRYPDQPPSTLTNPKSEKAMKPNLFHYTPFSIDVPAVFDAESWLLATHTEPSHCKWASDGKEVIDLRHTTSSAYLTKAPSLISDTAAIAFIDCHLTGDRHRVISVLRETMVVNSWSCVTMHQRPDGHLKFEWVSPLDERTTQHHVLTLNVRVPDTTPLKQT